MADMQVTVGLWREARVDFALIDAIVDVFGNYLAYEISFFLFTGAILCSGHGDDPD
jgi:hypothetical protein